MTEQPFSRRAHWEDVYTRKAFADVSWYQEVPERSLRQILETGVEPQSPVIDVGAGASTLVDNLLKRGFSDVTVLDISSAALEQARHRLGAAAGQVNWIVGDVTSFAAEQAFAIWHDRAVLHFLTDAADRERYVRSLKSTLAPGGYAILATFGPEGPLKCSGLEIRRYTVEMTSELLGPEFELTEQVLEDHRTPWGASQQFLHSSWKRREP